MEKIEEEINKTGSEVEKEPKYHFEEVFKQLESDVYSLVEKLKENIDRGEYDMLIGDDASGRIPTLILRGIINKRNKRLHSEIKSSEAEIKTRFVAGGYLNNEELSKPPVEELRSEIKNKALVVTEYIATGKSMGQLSSNLEKSKIPFDIATLTSDFNKDSTTYRRFLNSLKDLGAYFNINDSRFEYGRGNVKTPKNSKFFYGRATYDSNIAPLVYNKPKISGVIKPTEERLHAVPYKKFLLSGGIEKYKNTREGVINSSAIQEEINNAREDVNLLVKRILEKVWGEKKYEEKN